jgi:hypothetical protein
MSLLSMEKHSLGQAVWNQLDFAAIVAEPARRDKTASVCVRRCQILPAESHALACANEPG